MASLKIYDTNAMIAISQGIHLVDPVQVRVAISIITKIELLAWPSLSPTDRADLRRMLAPLDVINIDQTIEDYAIDIRTNCRLKLPDALIAATALSIQAPLVTNDLEFSRVPGLVLEAV